MNELKHKKVFLFAVVGGILGFIFHLVWHFWLNIELFSFASHVITGVIHTVIGVVIGITIWYLLKKKW